MAVKGLILRGNVYPDKHDANPFSVMLLSEYEMIVEALQLVAIKLSTEPRYIVLDLVIVT